jgi:hypothetical protein
MKKNKLYSNVSTTLLSVATLLILSGCQGGGGEITVSQGTGVGLGDLSVTSISGVSVGSIDSSKTDSSGYFLSNTGNVTIAGNCGRGVSKITAQISRVNGGTGAPVGNVVATEEATCSDLGEFTWTKTGLLGGSAVSTPVLSGLQYDVTLKTVGPDGSELKSVVVKLNIDNLGPVAPIVNTTYLVTTVGGSCIGTSPYTCTSFEDSGLISIYIDAGAEVASVTSSRGSVALDSGSTYVVSETLPGSGATTAYTIYSTDKAGNDSNVLTVNVSFNTNLLSPPLSYGGGSTFNGAQVGYTTNAKEIFGSIGVFGPSSVASPLTSFTTDLGAAAN